MRLGEYNLVNTGIDVSANKNQLALQNTKSIKEILLGTLKGNIRQYSMILAMLAIWVFFTIMTKGIFITSRNLSNLLLQCPSTGSAGVNMEMDAIASAVIGGTSTLGGTGTIYGCIIGALVMGSLDNGMSLMNANVAAQMIVKGAILVLAVWFDIKFSKRA